MFQGNSDNVRTRVVILYTIIMKRKIKVIGNLPKHNQFIAIIAEGKVNSKRTRGKSFFEEIFQQNGWKNSRRQRVTDMNGYDDEALESNDDDTIIRTVCV